MPLVGQALTIMESLGQNASAGPLLTSPRGHTPTSLDVAKAFERIRRDGVFETHTTPHDLRRTAATLMARLDIDQMTIARVLNTQHHEGDRHRICLRSAHIRAADAPRARGARRRGRAHHYR